MSNPSPWLFILLFPVFFAVLWLFVTGLLAYLSGWRSLARSYRGHPSAPADGVRMGSASMARWLVPVHFRNILNVTIGSDGLGLSLFPLFAAACPPLLVPWSEMRECRAWNALGSFARFQFKVGGVTVTLRGRAAAVVRDHVAQSNPRGELAGSFR